MKTNNNNVNNNNVNNNVSNELIHLLNLADKAAAAANAAKAKAASKKTAAEAKSAEAVRKVSAALEALKAAKASKDTKQITKASKAADKANEAARKAAAVAVEARKAYNVATLEAERAKNELERRAAMLDEQRNNNADKHVKYLADNTKAARKAATDNDSFKEAMAAARSLSGAIRVAKGLKHGGTNNGALLLADTFRALGVSELKSFDVAAFRALIPSTMQTEITPDENTPEYLRQTWAVVYCSRAPRYAKDSKGNILMKNGKRVTITNADGTPVYDYKKTAVKSWSINMLINVLAQAQVERRRLEDETAKAAKNA